MPRKHIPKTADETQGTELVDLLQSLLGATGDAVAYKSADDVWMLVNQAASQLIRIPVEKIIGANTEQIEEFSPFFKTNPLNDIGADREAFAAEMPISREATMTRPTGETRYYEVVRSPLYDQDTGEPRSLVIVCRDITTTKEAEQSAQAANLFAQAAIDSLSANICITDQDGWIIATNRSWKRFAEEHPPLIYWHGEGINYLDICRQSGCEEAKQVGDGISSVLEGTAQSFQCEYPCHDHLDPSKTYWNQIKVTRLETDITSFAVISQEDVTQRVLREQKTKHEATHDILTGLRNRAYFEETCRQAEETLTPVGVIMADLDGLKSVNDTFGHEAGDQLIKQAADCLKQAVRGDDVVARLGGDEFAILVKADKESTLDIVKTRILSEIEAANTNSTTERPLSLSIGASLAPSGRPISEAIAQADKAMYRMKNERKAGRD